MKWAREAIHKLKRGEAAAVHPRGHSMSGRIEDGQLVWLDPIACEEWKVGDVVLVRVPGKRREVVVLHQIIERDGERFLIGAHNGRIDGWVEQGSILGRARLVAPN